MIEIDGQSLTIDKLKKIAREREDVRIKEENKALVDRSAEIVQSFINDNKIIYGITTGFGNFAQVVIPKENIRDLQKNLLMSHSTGTGPYIDDDQVRAMMVLRVNALVKGFSGIRWETLQRILYFLNQGIHPLVPQKGSVGASGDLVHLAHMSAPLIGLGKVRYQEKV